MKFSGIIIGRKMDINMESVEYKGYQINITEDSDPMNPRVDWDHLGTMVCFHRRYNLGDPNHRFSGPEELEEFLQKNRKDLIVLPLRLYDHSGISISTSNSYPYNDYFDSGLVGFIFVQKETLRIEYKIKHITKKIREKTIKVLEQEVKTYNNYISGNVYGYSIEDCGEDLDCCSGYYGYDFEDNGLLQDARAAIDYHLTRQEEKR